MPRPDAFYYTEPGRVPAAAAARVADTAALSVSSAQSATATLIQSQTALLQSSASPTLSPSRAWTPMYADPGCPAGLRLLQQPGNWVNASAGTNVSDTAGSDLGLAGAPGASLLIGISIAGVVLCMCCCCLVAAFIVLGREGARPALSLWSLETARRLRMHATSACQTPCVAE